MEVTVTAGSPEFGRQRVDILESLRGVMALWVVVGHVCISFATPWLDARAMYRLMEQNARAVDVFMVLSGFVIFELLETKREPYPRYLYRRFMRLYPAYFVFLLVSVAMLPLALVGNDAINPATERDVNRSLFMLASLDEPFKHLLAHLTLLHGLVPEKLFSNSDFSILAQAWSLSLEWQFYILAPLAFYVFQKARPLLAYAGILAVALVLYKLRWWFSNEGFLGGHIGYFLLGIGCSRFWNSSASRGWAGRHADVLVFLAVAVCACTLKYWHLAFWFVTFGSALAMRDNPARKGLTRWVHDLLATRLLRWIGRISFSIYLVHMIPFFAFLWIVRDAGLSPITMLVTSLAITIPSTLILGAVSYHFIEAPMISFGRRPLWPSRPHPIARLA